MGLQCTFHAHERAEFLGWRVSRAGRTEIVYEGDHQRRIFRLTDDTRPDENLVAALQTAVEAPFVLPRLMDELKKRAIAVEGGSF